MSSSSSTFSLTERNSWGIASSCLAVILACAWKAIHMDVPGENSRGQQWLIRTRMTLWTIFVPEFLIRRAIIQRLDARKITLAKASGSPQGDGKKSNPEGNVTGNLGDQCVYCPEDGEPAAREWTNVHSFFLLMGGFTTRCENERTHTIRKEHLQSPHTDWPNVDVVDITDKSKGDSFTKAFVVLQTAWFVFQLIARATEGLAVTELEIMTLAYALSCFLLYVLWWDKPYDVQTPMLVKSNCRPPRTEDLPSQQPQPPPEDLQPQQPQPYVPVQRKPSLLVFQRVLSKDWIMFADGIIFEGANMRSLKEDHRTMRDNVIIRVVFVGSATVFGGIHCIPWNFRFPSTLEGIMWNTSAAIIAGAPPIMWYMLALIGLLMKQLRAYDSKALQPDPHPALCRSPQHVIMAVTTMMLQLAHLILIIMYCLARFILLIQAFVLLRDLSPSETRPISWPSLIPHV